MPVGPQISHKVHPCIKYEYKPDKSKSRRRRICMIINEVKKSEDQSETPPLFVGVIRHVIIVGAKGCEFEPVHHVPNGIQLTTPNTFNPAGPDFHRQTCKFRLLNPAPNPICGF